MSQGPRHTTTEEFEAWLRTVRIESAPHSRDGEEESPQGEDEELTKPSAQVHGDDEAKDVIYVGGPGAQDDPQDQLQAGKERPLVGEPAGKDHPPDPAAQERSLPVIHHSFLHSPLLDLLSR